MRMLIRMMSLLLLGWAMVACQGSLYTVKPDGLKHIRLGQAMPGPDNPQWRAAPYYDTLLVAGGYEWPAKVLRYPQGDVWIEGDFFGADLVNRIRVESPELRFKGTGGLAVGSQLDALKAQHTRWKVSHLLDFQRYDVVDPLQSHIHYLFEAPVQPSDTPSLSDLPDSARVIAIVLM